MIQFLLPIWLWASSAIAVPIIIHLWNVKQGKTLKIGSIAFLTENAKACSNSFKLSELLLLILRCLLLIVLAIILSKPRWIKKIEPEKEKGWVLMEAGAASAVYKSYKPLLDSLFQSGYHFRYFSQGFKEGNREDLLKMNRDSPATDQASYWTLLRDLNQQVPATLPVYLFTDNQFSRIKGSRPKLAANIIWITYRSTDSSSSWLANAYETINDSIRVTIGKADEKGTYYLSQNINPQTSNQIFRVSRNEGQESVNFYENAIPAKQHSITVDTTTLKIFIYTDRFATDAGYVKAAFNAISLFTQRKITVTLVTTVDNLQGEYNWLFWLSERKIPSSLLKGKLFMYETGKVRELYSNLITGDLFNNSSSQQIQLYKIIEKNNQESTYPLWFDGFGDTVLSTDKINPSIYRFYSRFNPQWNDLPWIRIFPQLIFQLLLREGSIKKQVNIPDKRMADQAQLQPILVNENVQLPKQKLLSVIDPGHYLWLIAFILFLLERVISYQKQNKGLS